MQSWIDEFTHLESLRSSKLSLNVRTPVDSIHMLERFIELNAEGDLVSTNKILRVATDSLKVNIASALIHLVKGCMRVVLVLDQWYFLGSCRG